MNYYLDTSVLVALILPDAHSQNADAWLKKVNPTLVTSDFCTIEFAAVVSRRVRMNNLSVPTANLALRTLDGWLARTAQVVPCAPHHMALAAALVRDFPTKLMAPDAIHLAVTKILGATIATFDSRLAEAAQRHAVAIAIQA